MTIHLRTARESWQTLTTLVSCIKNTMFCWRVVWYSFPSNKLEKVKCKTKLNVNNFEMCSTILKHQIMIWTTKETLYKVSENKVNQCNIHIYVNWYNWSYPLLLLIKKSISPSHLYPSIPLWLNYCNSRINYFGNFVGT